MITTFADTPQLTVFLEALKYKSFEELKALVIEGLENSEIYTANQILAIRLAAESLPKYPASYARYDGPLLGILNLSWEDIGVSSIDALTQEQRESILQGLCSVCKLIVIQAEIDRLTAIRNLDTALPEVA